MRTKISFALSGLPAATRQGSPEPGALAAGERQ